MFTKSDGHRNQRPEFPILFDSAFICIHTATCKISNRFEEFLFLCDTLNGHCSEVQLEAEIFQSWSHYKHILCRSARISCCGQEGQGILGDLGPPILSVKL